MAFIEAAHRLLEGAARGDCGAALRDLDANEDGSRWSMDSFAAAVAKLQSGAITSPAGNAKSAKPRLDTLVPDTVYELRHAVPLDGRWTDVAIVLRFTRKPRTGYFRVQLMSVERA